MNTIKILLPGCSIEPASCEDGLFLCPPLYVDGTGCGHRVIFFFRIYMSVRNDLLKGPFFRSVLQILLSALGRILLMQLAAPLYHRMRILHLACMHADRSVDLMWGTFTYFNPFFNLRFNLFLKLAGLPSTHCFCSKWPRTQLSHWIWS